MILFTLHLLCFDVTLIVQKLGRGAVLAKLDLKKTYRMVPIHPDDHAILGIRWGTNDHCSAPKIFSAVTDALAWVLHCKGVRWQIHYPDDFLFLGPPNEPVCTKILMTALDT